MVESFLKAGRRPERTEDGIMRRTVEKRRMTARDKRGKKMFFMILPFLILSFMFSYFPRMVGFMLFMIIRRR